MLAKHALCTDIAMNATTIHTFQQSVSDFLKKLRQPQVIPNNFFHSHPGIDFKQKLINLDGVPIKLQIWDTAGQERFRTLTTAYYRGAMGILLMYDVTSLESYNNLSYWLRNIQEVSPRFTPSKTGKQFQLNFFFSKNIHFVQNAAPDVVKVLAGNKCEATPTQRMVEKDRGVKV